MRTPRYETPTIPASGSLSQAVPTGEATLIGFALPAAWDAASLTFHGSATETGTFTRITKPDGTGIEVIAAADARVSLKGDELVCVAPWPWIKVQSVSVGDVTVAVNQTAESIVEMVAK